MTAPIWTVVIPERTRYVLFGADKAARTLREDHRSKAPSIATQGSAGNAQ